jgi:hypothetical protein
MEDNLEWTVGLHEELGDIRSHELVKDHRSRSEVLHPATPFSSLAQGEELLEMTLRTDNEE